MHTQFLRACATSLLAAAFLAGAVSAADAPAAASKWFVTFNGQAGSDGQMHFRVTPHEGEAIMITAEIHSGRGTHFIAQDVLAAFKAQAPKNRFKSEIVSGEQIIVKSAPGEAAFTLESTESSVANTRIHITSN